jgi:hypothetical protein
MVDTENRRKAVELIERFRHGEITNYRYEDDFPQSQDPVLREVALQTWFCYSDFPEYKLVGRRAPSSTADRLFKQCILFLCTDLEYSYSSSKADFALPFKNIWRRITFQPQIRVEPFPDYWPFESQEQLEHYRNQVLD